MKKVVALTVAMACLCGSAFAMTFTGSDELVHFTNSTMNGPAPRVTTKAQNKEKVAFTYYGKYVKLTSADGTRDYLSFISMNGKPSTFTVKTITTVDPGMKLWEIKAMGNAMRGHENCGFWLVGMKNNKFVTYISQDSLNDMGYSKNSKYPYHSLRTRVINGNYYIDASHSRNNQANSELSNILDFSVRADWDSQAQWFQLYYKDL